MEGSDIRSAIERQLGIRESRGLTRKDERSPSVRDLKAIRVIHVTLRKIHSEKKERGIFLPPFRVSTKVLYFGTGTFDSESLNRSQAISMNREIQINVPFIFSIFFRIKHLPSVGFIDLGF